MSVTRSASRWSAALLVSLSFGSVAMAQSGGHAWQAAALPPGVEAAQAGADQCAEREAVVWALVEGEGDDADGMITRYLNTNFALLQAKTDCQIGRYGRAVAIYDSLIAELTANGRATTAVAK